jgi:tetratricopeptide (TPR) repeat protein
LASELGDRSSAAWALIYLGGPSFGRPEEYQEAVESCEEGLAIFQDMGEKPGMALAYNMLGELARTAGEYDRAREVYEESLAISRQTGEKVRQFIMLWSLASIAYREGDYYRARDSFASYLRKMVEIGINDQSMMGLAGVAGSLGKLGEPEKAARLLGASNALMTGMGFVPYLSDQHELDKYIADVQAQLDEAIFEAACADGQSMTLEQAVAYALED